MLKAQSLTDGAGLAFKSDAVCKTGRMLPVSETPLSESRDVIATLAHEIRGPLAAIRGYITTIQDYGAVLPEGQIESYLDAADRRCLELDRLVTHLLAMSWLDESPLPEELEAIDLCQVIREVFYDEEMTSRHRRLSVRGMEEPLVVEANYLDLKLLLHNLADNACKYSPEDSLIVVKVSSRPNGHVAVGISNDGDIVSSVEASEIFLRFHRLQAPRLRGIQGAGIGLSIAKKVVERYHGQIWARPRSGGGLMLGFNLPQWREQSRAALRPSDF